MNISVMTLVVAALALIVAVATLVFSYKTYEVTQKNYMFTKDNSKGNIRKRLREDESRLEELNELIKKGTWGYAYVTDEHFDERDRLEEEIEDLKDRL